MTLTLQHLIDGHWRSGDRLAERFNPADTRELVARYPLADAKDAAEAVASARAAFPDWRDATPEVRSDILDRAGTLLIQRAPELGRLIAREEGKTLREGVAETLRAGRIFRYFAGEALRAHGQTLRSVRPNVDVETRRQAVGVFALVTPWNFPIAIPAWKAAPALAFGNTVVLKPAPETSATAAALAGVLQEAGVPPGVFNLLLGDSEAGAGLIAAQGLDGISFTGSQAVGAQVGALAGARQTRVQLEMGGKNPLVIMDDADMEVAIEIALDGAFLSTGQRCTASSRLIVHQDIHDPFIAGLQARMAALSVGDPLEPGTQIGPAVNAAQQARLFHYIDLAVGQGGVVCAGGEALAGRTPGWWSPPTLVAETRADMTVNLEEVFGPLATVVRVSDFEHALDVANAGAFGLSAAIATRSMRYAREFQRRVRAGMTMVNLPTAGVDYHVPFGGVGRSSYGQREQGFAAVDFFTHIATSYVRA